MSRQWWNKHGLDHIVPGDDPNPEFTSAGQGFDPITEIIGARARYSNKSGYWVDFGCGTGRLTPAFPCERYLGVDWNEAAIQKAIDDHSRGWKFRVPTPEQLVDGQLIRDTPYDSMLAYTVFQHMPDLAIRTTINNAKPKLLLIAEIMRDDLGRESAGDGLPGYDRTIRDYCSLLYPEGLALQAYWEKPYAYYRAKGYQMGFAVFRERR